MANLNSSITGVKNQAKRTVRQAGPGIEKLARIGYAAKGIVYIIIGVLAVEAASFGGGKMTNSQGALESIVKAPFGQFLLALVGVGLAAYALWRFVEAGLDAEHKGRSSKGVITRIGYVLSGIAYAALALTAFQVVMGQAHSNGVSNTQGWTARLLAEPFGQWMVGLVGLVIIGIGLGQIVKGYKADVMDTLKRDEMSANQQKLAVESGRWGYMARGVVFAIIGGFFVEAAIHADPQKAKGIGSALDLLIQQPYGPLLLGIVALGLVAYGVFMLVEARYRRITI